MQLEELNRQRMQEQQLQQQIATLDNLAKQYLAPDALSRYGSIKAAHPEKALQVMMVIAQSVQNGQMRERMTDEQLKELLLRLEKPKREFRITRK
ncbi:MAG: DNA-binding protein [Candidatus Woesearchaeota archaeon]